MKTHSPISAFLISLLLLAASPAYGAEPTSVAPEHIDRGFREPPQQPPAETTATPPHIPTQTTSTPSATFILRTFSIEGSTVYPEHTFDSIFAPKAGQSITFAEALSMARTITTRYRSDGYILSQALIAPKDFAEARRTGHLRIKIVEGFIHNVIIQNERPEADRRGLIQGYADKITAERPLNTGTLERYMLLINDLPGVKARAIIQPSPDTFGAADLVIDVKDKPIEASFTSDNRGNKYLGPFQEQATVTENSVAGLGERTTLRVINTLPFTDLHYMDIQHEEQIGSEGTKITGLISMAKTNPGNNLEALDFNGRSDDFALSVSHPFLRSRAENFTGKFTFDARNSFNSSLDTPLYDDRVRALRLGGAYDTNDTFNGVDLASLTVSQGINALGTTPSGAGRSRTVASQEFTKWNFDASRVQNLPHGFSFLTAATGQYSPQALLLSEQFTLGGVGFGQAYDNAELSGDKALAGKVELRYGQPVGQNWLDSYQIYGYYDLGSVYENDSTPGTDSKFSLASAGTGVRLNFTPNVYGYLELAFPLTRNVASEGDKDPRLFFSLTVRY